MYSACCLQAASRAGSVQLRVREEALTGPTGAITLETYWSFLVNPSIFFLWSLAVWESSARVTIPVTCEATNGLLY